MSTLDYEIDVRVRGWLAPSCLTIRSYCAAGTAEGSSRCCDVAVYSDERQQEGFA
jgi:hypothetical protein